ncbi:hypothetical protein FQ017_01915 [Flagellimonas pelagia]|uniref:Uncharacterized protein n=1 Tax=Flagellimonas pelagia TaxID=2306998 RepID=A0A3A1NNX8_9FLAO|nr:hypothetical protein D2V05_01930 [Allomuricauda maritima]TXJ99875.1 hypothetical protein FQ017_01915 [Allomuricauda maritima]
MVFTLVYFISPVDLKKR